ncbi:MAG: hypothetical protein FWF81_00245, partial [Defluviitaleaceae bacterium]|nr:hypothetical protein [Defluviitaleaceae bacterium]
ADTKPFFQKLLCPIHAVYAAADWYDRLFLAAIFISVAFASRYNLRKTEGDYKWTKNLSPQLI